MKNSKQILIYISIIVWVALAFLFDYAIVKVFFATWQCGLADAEVCEIPFFGTREWEAD